MKAVYQFGFCSLAVFANYSMAKLRHAVLKAKGKDSSQYKNLTILTNFLNFYILHAPLTSYVGSAFSFAVLKTVSDQGVNVMKVATNNLDEVKSSTEAKPEREPVDTLEDDSSLEEVPFASVDADAKRGGEPAPLKAKAKPEKEAAPLKATKPEKEPVAPLNDEIIRTFCYNIAGAALTFTILTTPCNASALFLFNLARFKMRNPNDTAKKIIADSIYTTLLTTTVLGYAIPVIGDLSTPVKVLIDSFAFAYIKPHCDPKLQDFVGGLMGLRSKVCGYAHTYAPSLFTLPRGFDLWIAHKADVIQKYFKSIDFSYVTAGRGGGDVS